MHANMKKWAGMEMYEAGWRTSLDAMAVRDWSIDSRAEDGGILGIDGWKQETPSDMWTDDILNQCHGALAKNSLALSGYHEP